MLSKRCEAAERFRNSLSIKSTQPEVSLWLGRTLDRLGQTNQAETAYRQALAHAPKRADIHLSLGRLPALLYGWFFFGMFLSGFLAPLERVQGLESGLVSEGWHLSVLAALLGTPVLVAYWLRMSGRWK